MRVRAISARRDSVWLLLALPLLAIAATAGSATAADLTPGAVFTQTNTAPNQVRAYNRDAEGELTFEQQIATGGNGRPANNPPAFTGFEVLDSAGSVNLSDDGDNESCLFVVNAGSNNVSSFRVLPDGLAFADLESSGGSRPASVSSTTRGDKKQVMYVLNSDNTSASIRGFYVSSSCALTMISGSDRALPSQASVPAAVRFADHGRFLTVSQRYAPAQPAGNGNLVTYPVDSSGLTGTPVVTPSQNRTPYGLDYNHLDILSVTNEAVDAPPFPNSTVSTFRQNKDGTLGALDNESSPGAASHNLFTNNGEFLYVSNFTGQFLSPASNDVRAYRVDRTGQMALVDQESAPFDPTDNALSHNSEFLYVLSSNVVTPGTASAINAYAIDPDTGALTPIDQENLPGNSTSGLAAW